MTLTTEQWKEVLDAVNLNGGGILEAIKEELKKQDQGTYQEWKRECFSVNHPFDITLTTYNEGSKLKSALLCIAASNGHLDIVKYLVDSTEADVNQKDGYDKTALYLAAKNGYLDVVKYLADNKKVNLDQKNYSGRSALHMAAFNGHLDTVKYLVDDKKVNLDQKDYFGRSALHMAAQGSRKDIVTTLLEKNANCLIKDKYGKSPRDLARGKGVMQLLKKAEIDQITSKTIKAGITSSIITALIVGIGCGIFDVELSILAIVSIAVAAALVIGTVAASITYLVLKPSNKLDKPDLEIANQQVDGKVY